jgi:hypothetical protein
VPKNTFCFPEFKRLLMALLVKESSLT